MDSLGFDDRHQLRQLPRNPGGDPLTIDEEHSSGRGTGVVGRQVGGYVPADCGREGPRCRLPALRVSRRSAGHRRSCGRGCFGRCATPAEAPDKPPIRCSWPVRPKNWPRDDGDLWDSGRVESNQSTQVVYAGAPLRSRMRCHWKVRLWDADGAPTPFSQPARWTMGLLEPGDFQAKWIGVDGPMTYPVRQEGQRAPLSFEGLEWIGSAAAGERSVKGVKSVKNDGKAYFRGIVMIPAGKVFRRTQLLTAAGGDYEVFVNGKPTARFGADNTRKAPTCSISRGTWWRERISSRWPSPARCRRRPCWPANW